ncbi:hypothetical protein NJ76_25765 [Rhodococcus sp. IITR03]|nr:hypothetical protein NJ76_25765 [Rhodococcus sp. IITR03]
MPSYRNPTRRATAAEAWLPTKARHATRGTFMPSGANAKPHARRTAAVASPWRRVVGAIQYPISGSEPSRGTNPTMPRNTPSAAVRTAQSGHPWAHLAGTTSSTKCSASARA